MRRGRRQYRPLNVPLRLPLMVCDRCFALGCSSFAEGHDAAGQLHEYALCAACMPEAWRWLQSEVPKAKAR